MCGASAVGPVLNWFLPAVLLLLTKRWLFCLQELFMAMDTDNDGRINSTDLHQALARVGAAIDEEEMSELFRVSDMSGKGVIDYEEFIAAMLDANRVAKRKDAVRRSFEQLDRDGDGYISVRDLAQVSANSNMLLVCTPDVLGT
eukprot:GHRQ01028831.1.p1 GENE.GHRQ01028831.1~~GHRQ01028831.1.p1  ORF type:complete len:157 (-),score=50.10 GHRQ01028831.1:349-780(-)